MCLSHVPGLPTQVQGHIAWKGLPQPAHLEGFLLLHNHLQLVGPLPLLQHGLVVEELLSHGNDAQDLLVAELAGPCLHLVVLDLANMFLC